MTRNKSTPKRSSEVKIHLPFLLTSVPEVADNTLEIRELTPTRLELISSQQINCFGDSDVLNLIGFAAPPKTLPELGSVCPSGVAVCLAQLSDYL